MELKRGKTFIKSSLHISHEKPSGPAATSPARDDAGPWSVSPRRQQQAHGERGPQVSPSAHGYSRCSNKGARPGPEGGATDLSGATFKLVWKSKSHNSVPEAGRMVAATGQLVGSASFPGPSASQRMIDYRHFVPQLPFVPAVAKSIPRKRISLKRSKKCFRNLFHVRRNKTENLASLATEGKNLPSSESPLEAGGQPGKAFFPLGEGLGLDSLCQDLSDSEFLPDSSLDFCRALCEDVASLKSFDSLTGCGEIFADESSVPSLELNEGPESSAWPSQVLESKARRGSFQGSVEQLASAQNEVSDFAKFWDSVNQSVRQQQRARLGPWLERPQGTDTAQPRPDSAGLMELPLCPCQDLLGGSKSSSIDTGTPKSEQPESVSTSDEGYYDAFSPSLEDDKKDSLSPGTPAAAFPRESYSGDALYELFYDPSKGPVGLGLDDDLCVSESLSGPAPEASLSMCSFHMGAEENLALGAGPNLLSQGFLQSSWKGKECLLKLCDTELAITMGIINWLRRSPELRASSASPPEEPAATLRRSAAVKPEAGSEKRGPSPGELEGRGAQAADTDEATVGSAPGGQELWAHPGLRTKENEVLAGAKQGPCSLSKGLSLNCVQDSEEEATRGCCEGPFSAVESTVSKMADTSSKNKVVNPFAWPHSQELRPPGNARCFRDQQEPDLRGSTLDTEPTLTSCVAQVAALQIHPDCESHAAQLPRQDTSGRLCGQPQTKGIDSLKQKQPNSFPQAAVCGLPSLTRPRHSPQDGKKCPDLVLDLSRLQVEPARLDAQVCASAEEQLL
ncbi:LOW QUALITY PROTEIN: APC membrane recruitment protein 3 [Saccopteryx leptura]|uniref:LOW QUALITY PROTEIN: APC membrane recruitment protein 3 n=1 Tax=Saccopteryx leptura TaxID=249018 RepID=UPI00339C7A21